MAKINPLHVNAITGNSLLACLVYWYNQLHYKDESSAVKEIDLVSNEQNGPLVAPMAETSADG